MAWRNELIRISFVSWKAWRANGYKEVPPQPRCPLVNPLCPEDLCVLPPDHPGTVQGYHVLGTDPYDDPHRYIRPGSHYTMMPVGTSDEELKGRGAELQEELFPDQ